MENFHTNFVFFGTPPAARDTLAHLVKNGFVPKVVVTNPDRPQGRGLVLQASPTKIWAQENNIPVFTPEKWDAGAIENVRSYNPAYGVVVAYGKILPPALLEVFPRGIFNVHYSLLPAYRGAAPVEAAILRGDTMTGVSVQKVVAALDAGDVFATRGTEIMPTETARDLRQRLVVLGADLLTSLLPAILAGDIEGIPQDSTCVTYAPKIKKEDGKISLADDPHINMNKYRAYSEWPGVYFFARKGDRRIRVKVTRARFHNGSFIIERVTPEGKREQSYDTFVRAGWIAE